MKYSLYDLRENFGQTNVSVTMCQRLAGRSYWSGLIFRLTVSFILGAAFAADASADFHWAPAQKEFLGTALSPDSKVYFTGAQGILTEVFYPSPDLPQSVDLQFLVEDSAHTFGASQAEEKNQPSHLVELVDKRAMLWRSTTTCPQHWQTIKEIYSDPHRNSVIEDVTFRVLDPAKKVSDFDVYVLHKPAIETATMAATMATLTGTNNAQVELPVAPETRTTLCAWVSEPRSPFSALAASLPWKTQNGQLMAATGISGVSDGWTDLFGPGADHVMHHFDQATQGNVAEMGLLDFGNSQQKEIRFTIVLSFGTDLAEATAAANGTLDHMADLKEEYVEGWHDYTAKLLQETSDQYYLAAMTLKSSADKTTGAMVAGMGSPWGEKTAAADGYHRVWARDLFKFSSALLAAGDTDSANKVATFLFQRQMLPDGQFPRYSLTDGTPLSSDGVQLDQTALPIVLAWKLKRTDLWPEIKTAANYLLKNGPSKGNERWEEQPGFSPSTIAAEIAGLVCAADLAAKQNPPETELADSYLKTADFWRANLTTWLVTLKGPISQNQEPYFLRISELGTNATVPDPDSDQDLEIPSSNHIPQIPERDMVDAGFLEIVRFGIMSPNDWSIRESIPVIDHVIKQTVDGKFDGFFRYNFDGYGQNNNGDVWSGAVGGRGRLWPLLSAERGIYEIERGHDGSLGGPYLKALERFSSPQGFIPEQVYGLPVTFVAPGTSASLDVSNPPDTSPGDSTGSMRPLSWAMGEYINLLIAMQVGHNDAPQVVKDRYLVNEPVVKVNFSVNAVTDQNQSQVMNLVGDTPLFGDEDEKYGIRLSPLQKPKWTATLSLPANHTFKYHFYRSGPNQPNLSGMTFTLNTGTDGSDLNIVQNFP
jgi:glucoamylase